MACGSQPTNPEPSAPPEQYRQQVAASIQSLVAGRRPRDPQMSGASTGRLIIEGVVENVRIYRLHKEEKAREAKNMEEEERRRREKRSRRHARDSSRERRRGHRSSRPERDGERHQRRRHHRRHSDDGNGHPRHRRQTDENRSGRDLGHRGDRVEVDQSEQYRNRSGPRDEPRPSHSDHAMSGALPVGAAVAAKVAEKVEERLFGPDGTLFGHLPTRDKGIGLLSHARTTYQHIKVEQDAGHRSKGPAEKLIHGWLKKRRSAKSVANRTIEEEELLTEKNTLSRGERSGRHGDRRKHRRSKSRGGNRDAGRGGHPVFVPVVERGESSGGGQGIRPPTGLRRSFEQPAPSARQPTVSRPPSRPNSSYDRDRSPGPEPGEYQDGRVSSRASSVHVEPPAQPASVGSYVPPAPLVRGVPSVRDVDRDDVSDSPSGSRVPTIHVQSPTPPEQANSVRSPTLSVQEVPSRFQSPEPRSHESATAAWSPAASRYGSQPPPGPTLPPAVATPYPTAPSVVDMPAPVLHIAPPPPPPPPPLSAPIEWHVVDTGRDALLASIQVGVKLKKVGDADEKDASLACKDEACIEDITRQAPAYEGTPHAYDVEALEHAQAVEERQRQEEERVSRSKTPFIAPQPRPNMSINFQEELAAKLSKVKLKKADGDVSEGAPSEALKVVKPRASNETWRTVFSNQEPYSEPDQAFRERLGSALSARGTTQPPPAVTVLVAAPAREVTPDPDVVVNLSANIAGLGWSFDNVLKDDEA